MLHIKYLLSILAIYKTLPYVAIPTSTETVSAADLEMSYLSTLCPILHHEKIAQGCSFLFG